MDVIVDAYNVIFKIPELGGNAKKCDIEDLRDRFLSALKQYKAERKHRLIVVFDGKGLGPSKMTEAPEIDVIFSMPGLDADEEIKKFVSNSKRPRQIIVVTSDRNIIQFVKKYGSKVMEPVEFYKDVVKKITCQTSPEEKKKKEVDEREPISKYIGPSRAETEYWLKYFSKKIGKLSND